MQMLQVLPARKTAPSSEVKQLLNQMEDLRGSLNLVLAERQQAASRLNVNIQGFTEYQLALDNRRKEIEQEERGRIATSKAAREAADKDERERLRQLGEKERRRWRDSRLRMAMALGLTTTLVLVLLVFIQTPRGDSFVYPYLLWYLAAVGYGLVVASLLWVAARRRELLASPFIQRAGEAVPDLKFLDQDAVRLGRSIRRNATIFQYLLGETRPSPASFRAALRDPNPQVRYLAARTASYEPRVLGHIDHLLLEALNAETWLPAQAALLCALVSLAESGGNSSNMAIDELRHYLARLH